MPGSSFIAGGASFLCKQVLESHAGGDLIDSIFKFGFHAGADFIFVLIVFIQIIVLVIIITVINSIQFVGVSMIIYLAGLQTLDQSVMEAASLDGATGWNKFWNITLPLLQPSFTTSVVLNLIGGLKLFDMIKILTGGGPGYATNSLSTYISSVYFDAQNAGYASALGVVLFVIIAVLTYLLNVGLAKLNWEA